MRIQATHTRTCKCSALNPRPPVSCKKMFVLAGRVQRGDVGVAARLAVALPRHVRHAVGGVRVRRQPNALRRVQVQILFREHKGQVRLMKTDGQEKRRRVPARARIADVLQRRHGVVGDLRVQQGPRFALVHRGPRVALRVRGVRLLAVHVDAARPAVLEVVLARADVRRAPRLRGARRRSRVEYLAHPERVVSAVFKVLRERGRVGQARDRAEVRVQVPDVRCARVPAREQRRPVRQCGGNGQ